MEGPENMQGLEHQKQVERSTNGIFFIKNELIVSTEIPLLAVRHYQISLLFRGICYLEKPLQVCFSLPVQLISHLIKNHICAHSSAHLFILLSFCYWCSNGIKFVHC